MKSGICAENPDLPCCKSTKQIHMMFNRGPVADLNYPDCRADGFFEAKQCHWGGCYCVTPKGKDIAGTFTTIEDILDLSCEGQKLSTCFFSCCEEIKDKFAQNH
jgi:hypothetical protein